jgi:serine/threonine protein kinase
VKLDEYHGLEDRPISEWIKDFRVMREIEVLGKGGFGVVKLVEDAFTGERIAVKSLHEPDPDLGTRFRHDVEMLIRLRHPCVLSIVGYLIPTQTSRAQIGTEFAVNGSLRSALDKLRNGSPPNFMNDTGIAIIVSGLAHGMKFIHSSGAIHRDLKPENVLLDARGWVFIGDLGSSRLVDMEVTRTKIVGTPLYMAPEMYDEGEYTTTVDVYSFGLMVYELLASGPVFSRTIAPGPLMKKVITGEHPKLPASMNGTVKEPIGRCDSVDPNARSMFDEIVTRLPKVN